MKPDTLNCDLLIFKKNTYNIYKIYKNSKRNEYKT